MPMVGTGWQDVDMSARACFMRCGGERPSGGRGSGVGAMARIVNAGEVR